MALGAGYNHLLARSQLGRAGYAALKRAQSANGGEVTIAAPSLKHPITLRSGSSDAGEFVHTVVRSTYDVSLPPPPVRMIVDAGANFGDSTAWYLSRFPGATVVALEPDPRNFDVLCRNVEPYGARCRLLRAALWPTDARLCVRRLNQHSDVFVEEARDGEPADCAGLSPDSLLADLPAPQVDIFKCDIEGAEVALFSRSDMHWLSRVRALYIDAHSAQAIRTLQGVAAEHGFTFQRHRELCVLNRK